MRPPRARSSSVTSTARRRTRRVSVRVRVRVRARVRVRVRVRARVRARVRVRVRVRVKAPEHLVCVLGAAALWATALWRLPGCLAIPLSCRSLRRLPLRLARLLVVVVRRSAHLVD